MPMCGDARNNYECTYVSVACMRTHGASVFHPGEFERTHARTTTTKKHETRRQTTTLNSKNIRNKVNAQRTQLCPLGCSPAGTSVTSITPSTVPARCVCVRVCVYVCVRVCMRIWLGLHQPETVPSPFFFLPARTAARGAPTQCVT